MLSYDEIRRETLALFPGLIDTARRYQDTAGLRHAGEPLDRLEAAQRQLHEGSLRVVVCGEFNRGKSRLLNALLGEYQLLPEGQTTATSVVTTVAYGKAERITVHVADAEGGLDGREIKRGDLRGYVTEKGNKGNVKRVQRVDIEIPSRPLESGLVLVDTPGIGGLEASHRRVTDRELSAADAIVFVTDVELTLTAREKEFLREAAGNARVRDDTNAMLFVLTKIDGITDPSRRAEFTDRTRHELAAALGRKAGDVPLIAVSSKAREKYLKSSGSTKDSKSNFGELEEALWATLARRQAGMLLHGALADIELAAESMARPIREAMDALESPATAETRAGTIRSRVQELNEQAAVGARWRIALDTGIAAMQDTVTTRVTQEADELWERLRARLDSTLLDDQVAINRIVADNVDRLCWAARGLLDKEGAALLNEIATRYAVTPENIKFTGLPAPRVPAIRIRAALASPPPVNWGRFKAYESVSEIGGTSFLRIIVASLGHLGFAVSLAADLGGAVAPAATAAVILGPRLRVHIRQRRERQERLSEGRTEVNRVAGEVTKDITSIIAEASRVYGEAIRADMESRIHLAQASAEESARQLHSRTGPQDEASATAVRTQLAGELARLERTRERVAELARATGELMEGRPHA